MIYGESPYGEVPYGALTETGVSLSLQIDIAYTGEDAGDLFIPLKWKTTDALAITVPVEYTGELYSLSIPARWETTSSYSLSIPFSWEVSDVSSWPRPAVQWTLTVLLDGADVSALLTGTVEIDREEDSSGLAKFSIIPAPGPIDPMSWMSKVVFIDVAESVAGVQVSSARRYSGIVSNAVYDPETGVVAFTATTDLQGIMENMDRETIDSIIGGYWSPHVFDDGANGWDYATDQLSTVPKSIWHDNNRQVRLTEWAAKTTPDFTFTDAGRFGGSLKIERATRRELINRLRISVDYRFVRLRQREITVSCSVESPTPYGFLLNPVLYPTKEMIENAARGGSWQIIGEISFVELMPGGVYFVPSNSGLSPWVYVVYPNVREVICRGGSWRAGRRWAQTVTETYSLDIRADNSIEYSGEIGIEERYAVSSDYDAGAFESDPFSDPPAGAVKDAIGDYVLDVVDDPVTGRTAFENAQQTIMAAGRVDILRSHRQNIVSFEIPFHQKVNLSHTVRVSGSYLTAMGKVRRVVDRFSIDSGEAVTGIEIALSLHGGSGVVTDSPLDPIPAPETEPLAQPVASIRLPSFIGGQSGSPGAIDDTQPGLYTDYNISFCNRYQCFGRKLIVEMPEIESEARDATEAQAAETIRVDIPQDELTMSA